MSKTTEKLGPGVWWTIHKLAKKKEKYFQEFMIDLSNNFFCLECQEHFKEYLVKHPIPNHSSEWFKWSVNFHNKVNVRLGKPVLTLERATELYEKECESCKRNVSVNYKGLYF